MLIKQFDKQGVVAWSNSKVHSELLASASFQEDNGLYHLDILSLDLQQRSRKINVIGNGYTDSAFRCIAWDNFGEKENTYPHGLIFTGMDDASFKLWNPSEMVATYPTRQPPALENIEQQTCIIYEEELENEFPVMCAEWNSLNNNMLAFGTTDVFILIVDKDPSEPDLRKPGKKNPHNGSYVTSVSWNREVSHILASASENGLVALWDIKTNNSIFQFRDSGASTSSNRNVQICWSKNISTQIAVTLDDEKHNELQIWDLRNQKGPVVVIDKCHTKGINAMDWCETDPSLILTSSRDKKVVCWNYTQEEEPLSQTTLQSQTVSVKWSKKLPSIYSVSTDEKTLIYTLNDANLFSYVPKWYKVPVGSTIFGNDSVVTYSEQRGNILHETNLPDYNKKSLIRPKLKELAQITQTRPEQIESESELFNLLKAKSGENDTEIYDFLGFSKSKIVQEVQKYTGKKREFAAGSQKEKSTKHKPKAYTQIQGQDALAFFASINTQSFEQTSKSEQDQNTERVQYDMVPRNFNWDLGKEKIVKQNILIGNYEGAIDAALKCGRTAEALIIAYSVDINLFNNTLKTFFTETTDSFITDVLKHIAYKDAFELVKKYDLNNWKEGVALIFSLASRDKRSNLLKVLADRLRNESQDADVEKEKEIIPENYSVIICHILAEQFNAIAEIYYQNLKLFESGSQERKLAAIEYARRLILIYEHLTVEISDLRLFQKIVREVAFIAIENHEKTLAHHLLSTFAHPNSQKILDYLITTTKELQKYKASIRYKPLILPTMQSKKQEKKTAVKGGEVSKPQKPKAKIFEKEEEVPPPPPQPKKRTEETSDSGFSPYQHQRPNEIAPKKNLNTPPPMPVAQKKPPAPAPIQEEQSPKKNFPPPGQSTKLPPSSVVKKPPPPPNQALNQSHAEDREDSTYGKPQKPSTRPPPPPSGPVPIEKKHSQPPIIQKHTPPPQMQKPIPKHEVSEPQEQEHPRMRPPPANLKNLPPPPRSNEPEEIKEEQNVFQKKPLVKPPPPPKVEEQKARVPPTKQEQKMYEEPQEVSERVVKKVAPILPPPPVKKGVPPPPIRK